MADDSSRIDIRTVFAAVDIPTIVLDADGEVVVWNDPVSTLLGIDRATAEAADDIGAVLYDETRTTLLAEKVVQHPEDAAEMYDIERADSEYALLSAPDRPTYEDTSTAIGGSGADIWFLATPLYRDDEFVGVVEFVQQRADSERRRREMDHLLDELLDTLSSFQAGEYSARAEYDFAAGILNDDDVALLEEINDLARMQEALRQQVHETREAKAELERRNEQLEQFASVVAHDLRNPLNVAQSRLELVDDDIEHLADAARSLDRMEQLIDDLLLLARTGVTVEDTEPIDLGSLAAECWQIVETGDATLAVDTELTVTAARPRLRQVLENLMRNAIDHGDGTPTVRVGELDDADGFYVADDGPGIPLADRSTVFESGYSTDSNGTGLGLAIVEDIAEAHGWSVRVTESTDGGARFEFLV